MPEAQGEATLIGNYDVVLRDIRFAVFNLCYVIIENGEQKLQIFGLALIFLFSYFKKSKS